MNRGERGSEFVDVNSQLTSFPFFCHYLSYRLPVGIQEGKSKGGDFAAKRFSIG